MNGLETVVASENINGGPAFPSVDSFFGMNLRDYFASKAMNGILTDPEYSSFTNKECKGLAEHSYRIADAMLEARKK